MPKFRVPITRDVTVTAYITVEAESPTGAVCYALEYARDPNLNWELDDCEGGEPYFAGDDDLDAVEQVLDGPTVTLNFNPQAWMRDYAMSVDPEGDTTWEVSRAEFLAMFPDEATFNSQHQLRDDLRHEGTAPKWIRDWSGPFEVELFTNPQEVWPDA
jgi:hypothetical protein